MKDRGRMDVCYNTHIVVDSKNHIIVEYEATNNASDNNSLSRMTKNATAGHHPMKSSPTGVGPVIRKRGVLVFCH